MNPFRFEPGGLPPEAEELRAEVRSFLDEELRDLPASRRAWTWMGSDPAFSRKLAARGWLGLTWPSEYGGHERSALERYALQEELLVAGAPVGAHWIGDRQTGPLLLRFGTDEQRRRILPAMARGELFFAIGMSEPDTGSDLASVRTRAAPCDGGWRVTGTKIWTSGAAGSDMMIALVRTSGSPESRREGLSQVLIDLRGDGVAIRPIRDLAGNDHFCEVVFEDAFVPDENLVGHEGAGWSQVMAELAYERSGPERFLSCFLLLDALAEAAPPEAAAALGREIAELATLRSLSLSVAGMLDRGENPALEAAVVKDLGAVFEQRLPGLVHDLIDLEPSDDEGASDLERLLAVLTLIAPSFSLRGGTREILRGIIARGLGLR